MTLVRPRPGITPRPREARRYRGARSVVESSEPSPSCAPRDDGDAQGVQRDLRVGTRWRSRLRWSRSATYGAGGGRCSRRTSGGGRGHSLHRLRAALTRMTSILARAPDPAPTRYGGRSWRTTASTMFRAGNVRAPCASRTQYMKRHDTSSLRKLFLAGEPLDEPTPLLGLGVPPASPCPGQLTGGARGRVADPGRYDAGPGGCAPLKAGSAGFPCVELRRQVGTRVRQKRSARTSAACSWPAAPLPPGC